MAIEEHKPYNVADDYKETCRRTGLGWLSLVGGAALQLSIVLMAVYSLTGSPGLSLVIFGGGLAVFILLVTIDAARAVSATKVNQRKELGDPWEPAKKRKSPVTVAPPPSKLDLPAHAVRPSVWIQVLAVLLAIAAFSIAAWFIALG